MIGYVEPSPMCGRCGHLNPAGFCNMTACLYPNTVVGYIPTTPQTNADRIRAMSDEELAEQIAKCVEADFFRVNVIGIKPNSKDDWLDWLNCGARMDEEGKE